MANNVDNFIQLANFYNQLTTVMSAICVQKGGIAIENYVGRFFAADVLEFIVEYGKKLEDKQGSSINADIASLIARFSEQYEIFKGLTTPTQKPIYEMTLEEFEKVMNI
ncbi:MAG: hypothetical protein JW974_00850 [Alphaproteobacteria bacterium]|nr:hypothetical protein [Alphaproteobacteria bacterium]MBN2674935.1 hypothetical protein [Alphaproteobacteria bacterium]